MTKETVFANAQIVLADEVITGSLVVRDGMIAEIAQGAAVPLGALDCDGDLLAPGLIELHTDNLERHIQPRPKVEWPHGPAIVAHDAELAGCGVTTVFDAIRVGSILTHTKGGYAKYARSMATEILEMRAAGALKISHHLHLRAETCSETLIDELAEFGCEDRIGIISLMDHTPGQRQFRDISKFEAYVRGKSGMAQDAFDEYCRYLEELHAELGQAHEAATVATAQKLGALLASHDDTTTEQVGISAGYGVKLAEFPTTQEAAAACHGADIQVMMGAPNLIRGGSHSGNVAAADLAQADLLDVLSSDYVPAALLTAAMQLADLWDDTARGLATVTAAPARATGLTDRGVIAPGLRADLIRLRRIAGIATLRGVWVSGARVG
ncbi:alpha-D-ribose 1-methylphosphonate 5-triphosphate diphosphatase [Actibacterium sp. 188UL27-1]|nr:alpha-D-ribose 1-methylphosphonate 5-triphosphate diphosphatase [Actibacterium sp. 188UL27-1]MBM7067962.1 alpha-D-ribose 1-methylphosphonate 5-triphosphate diphosphatase [Actibacterium sp. 188UL27-1]